MDKDNIKKAYKKGIKPALNKTWNTTTGFKSQVNIKDLQLTNI